MTEETKPVAAASADGSSAATKEPDGTTVHGTGGSKPQDDTNGLNNPVQVQQDSRVDKAKADARAQGGGPDTSEEGLNPDG